MTEQKPGFWTLGRIIQVCIGVFALALIAVNFEKTSLNLLFLGDVTLPKAIFFGGFFLLGFLACWINQRFSKQ